jgi:hypothetical protein
LIVLDENFPETQRAVLRGWRIPVRQIGVEVGRSGMQDDEMLPLLCRLRRPTFFTLDGDFYRRSLRHPRYCLVSIDTEDYEAASAARRFLQHPTFDTDAKRMGSVVRLSQGGLVAWLPRSEVEVRFGWQQIV